VKFLLVGSGAREHAIAAALCRHGDVELYAVCKQRNPGILALAKELLVADETDPQKVAAFASKHRIECAAIGPEAPLLAGVSDAIRRLNIAVAAPSRAAAEIETSKRYMRDLLTKHKVPGNIRTQAYDSADAAKAALRKDGIEVALKPIGLTGGKGVKVFGDHFTDYAGAAAYVDEVFAHKIGGPGILIEERLQGEEFTLQCFADGRRVVPTVAVQDHKRLLPDDKGPNTGGMGSYSQADGLLPFLGKKAFEEALSIVRRIVEALNAENRPYIGPIYGQFMLTKDGPKVIEVNARFGDPEALNVLATLQTPYAEIASRMANQRLVGVQPRFEASATVVKYVVPEGYGTKPLPDVEIKVDPKALAQSRAEVYFANVEKKSGSTYVSAPSRSLAVLGRGETVHQANEVCEAGLKAVSGAHIFVRHDIGTKALLERRVQHMRLVQGAA
jgi:phosphoribosylamine--glycine ligase